MSSITLVAACVLAVVFGWGGIAKLVRFTEWKEVLRRYGPPRRALPAISLAVPLAELAVVALLATGRALAGAALTLALVALYSPLLVGLAQRDGGRVPCGCFGRATLHDYRLLVARNAGIACLAAIILIYHHDRLAGARPGLTGAQVFPAALALGGGALALWAARELTEALHRR